jgi:hypothetical protein
LGRAELREGAAIPRTKINRARGQFLFISIM